MDFEKNDMRTFLRIVEHIFNNNAMVVRNLWEMYDEGFTKLEVLDYLSIGWVSH